MSVKGRVYPEATAADWPVFGRTPPVRLRIPQETEILVELFRILLLVFDLSQDEGRTGLVVCSILHFF